MKLHKLQTHEVEHNCHIPALGINCCVISKLILLFYGVIRDLYQENLAALGSGSCSSSQKPASDSFIKLYHWGHWAIKISCLRLLNFWMDLFIFSTHILDKLNGMNAMEKMCLSVWIFHLQNFFIHSIWFGIWSLYEKMKGKFVSGA
jgi:hypothetical protein